MLDPVLSGKSDQDGGNSEFVANIAAKKPSEPNFQDE